MPKQTKFSPGERVDIVDLTRAANDYTADSAKFLLEREWIDRRSRILDGFRVRVEDQTATPGQITIYNGNAVDRTGQLINNEDTVNDSRSITLLGTSTNFYIEIEFTTVPSDTDARFFWDPTVPNAAPIPAGSEFNLSVATRLTPDWQIVNPPSTTGFQQSTNPNSVRIPLCVFRTNGSNQIVGGSNPGLTLVFPASVLEADTASGVNKIRVIDCRYFPTTTPFTVTVDVGGTSPESKTVTGIDRDNSILTMSSSLSSNHSAGAIVQVSTAGENKLVKERVDPSDPALDPLLATPGHPDMAQRLWEANEVRGSALQQSKEAFGARDDLNLRSLKDYVDFLSAQIRELKFGSSRPETTSTAPPASFATRPRYFDPAGGVAGARSNTVSIGNGTTTFGDFNGTTETVFIAAIAALPTNGGIIYVKTGSYAFANAVTTSKPVVFVGESTTGCVITNNNATNPAFLVTHNTSFRNMTIQKGGGGNTSTINVTASITTSFDTCVISGEVLVTGSVSGVFQGYGTTFSVASTGSCFATASGGSIVNSLFRGCSFSSGSANGLFQGSINGLSVIGSTVSSVSVIAGSGTDTFTSVHFSDCLISTTFVMFSSGTQTLNDIAFRGCKLTITTVLAGFAPFYFISTNPITGLVVSDCVLTCSAHTTTFGTPGSIVQMTGASIGGIQFVRNSFTCPTGSFIYGFQLDPTAVTGKIQIESNSVIRAMEGVRIGSGAANLVLSVNNVFTITGNYFDNAGEHTDVFGVNLVNNPKVSQVMIDKNVFINFNSTAAPSGSGIRVGCDVTTANTSIPANIVIINNLFTHFGTGGTANVRSCFGVRHLTPGTGKLARVSVKNNSFVGITAVGADTAAVLLQETSSGGQEFIVSENVIYGIGYFTDNTSTPQNAIGISLSSGACAATDNTVTGVSTNNASFTAAGILFGLSGNAIGNKITSCGTPAVGTPSLIGSGIKHLGSVGIISNNTVDQTSAGDTGPLGIILLTDNCQGMSITNNDVTGSTAVGVNTFGIYVRYSSTTAAQMQNISVNNNNIKVQDLTAGGGISITTGGPSYSIEVQDNNITEVGLPTANRTAIGITGNSNTDQTRGITVTGNTLTGVKSGTLVTGRVGIQVTDCRLVQISNNTVDWNEPGVAEGRGIYLLGNAGTWKQFSINDNLIQPNGNVANAEIDIDTAHMVDGLAAVNSVGNSSNTGLVNPAVAAGNWTYANNKLS